VTEVSRKRESKTNSGKLSLIFQKIWSETCFEKGGVFSLKILRRILPGESKDITNHDSTTTNCKDKTISTADTAIF
jgi:hypothetical protein